MYLYAQEKWVDIVTNFYQSIVIHLYVYIHIYKYVYTCTWNVRDKINLLFRYIYTYQHFFGQSVCVHTYVQMHIYMYMKCWCRRRSTLPVHMCIYIQHYCYMLICIHTYMHVHESLCRRRFTLLVHICVCTYICVYIYSIIFMFLYVYIHINIYMESSWQGRPALPIYVCTCVPALFSCLYMYTYIHTNTYIHVRGKFVTTSTRPSGAYVSVYVLTLLYIYKYIIVK